MRQRQVYVIEFKAKKGRRWYEADCETGLSFAKAKLFHLIRNNPDDNWRLVKYYPRDDKEIK